MIIIAIHAGGSRDMGRTSSCVCDCECVCHSALENENSSSYVSTPNSVEIQSMADVQHALTLSSKGQDHRVIKCKLCVCMSVGLLKFSSCAVKVDDGAAVNSFSHPLSGKRPIRSSGDSLGNVPLVRCLYCT